MCRAVLSGAAGGVDEDDLGTITTVTSFSDDGVAVSKLKTTNLLSHLVEDHAIGSSGAAAADTAVRGAAVGAESKAEPIGSGDGGSDGGDDDYADMTTFTEDNLVVDDMVGYCTLVHLFMVAS